MFLNIITPCSRPENLQKISKTINIPKEHYRWIVVCDMDKLPSKEFIPENCEVHLYRKNGSVVGHAQRNYALSIINNGYIYFNDDDTLLHPELWENIKDIDTDFISFIQSEKDGSIRLLGNLIQVSHIDSHNFIVSKNTIGDTKFIIDRYDADGYFAKECYEKSLNKTYIDKSLSIYNSLR